MNRSKYKEKQNGKVLRKEPVTDGGKKSGVNGMKKGGLLGHQSKGHTRGKEREPPVHGTLDKKKKQGGPTKVSEEAVE